MKHARVDYDRIQDPAGLIGEDEPVFLLRAKDVVAAKAVRAWAALAAVAGADLLMVNASLVQADRMEFWQEINSCKVPDMPEAGKRGKYEPVLSIRETEYILGQKVGFRGTKRAPDPEGWGASIMAINGSILDIREDNNERWLVDLEDLHE